MQEVQVTSTCRISISEVVINTSPRSKGNQSKTSTYCEWLSNSGIVVHQQCHDVGLDIELKCLKYCSNHKYIRLNLLTAKTKYTDMSVLTYYYKVTMHNLRNHSIPQYEPNVQQSKYNSIVNTIKLIQYDISNII